MKHPIVFALVAMLVGFSGMARGSDSSPAFSFFAPSLIVHLKNEASTPAGQSIIRQAGVDVKLAPAPLPHVHTEGTLPHHGIRDQSFQAEEDWDRMRTLAFAYRLTGEPSFLEAEDRFLTAWLDLYHIGFNPIDETRLDRMILAYDLTAADLPETTRTKMSRFLHTLAEGYLDRIEGEKKTDISNWQSHRIKLATLAAYGSNDSALIARARQAFQHHVAVNIQADGSVYDFHQRDAIHYAVYDLEPLIMAALAARSHGEDWFHVAAPGQPSVSQAIDWLTPYTSGQKSHEEFAHSPVAFDAARAKAGEKGYCGPWDPSTSIYLYQLATLADPKYAPLLHQLDEKTPGLVQDWLTVAAHAGD